MNVRIPCIKGYNEDQITIVLDDPSMKEFPLILGTPTLYRAVQVIKGSENNPASCPVGHVALLLSHSRLTGLSGDRR